MTDLAAQSTQAPAGRELAVALERFLEDPFTRSSRVPFSLLMSYDERDEPTLPFLRALDEWGCRSFFIPRSLGGELHDIGQIFALIRTISRRDLAPAITLGITLLGAMPIWAFGDERQRVRAAEIIKSGGYGSFGLSEAAHGGDILAAEAGAKKIGHEYVLTGTKWPIGNATWGKFATVFVNTGGGPRGFSTFFVDKTHLEASGWCNEPRVRLLGLRGCDVSGITFNECRLPEDAVVGNAGHGLDHAIKTLQVSRTMITAMSLGAVDTGLRITLGHVRRRVLYDRPVYELPVVREQVLSAFVDILVAECVATATTRAIAFAPTRLSLWSSVAKYLVTLIVDEALASLSSVLAARHFFREGVAEGVFQKILRDHRILATVEGTSHVHLHVVATQLVAVWRNEARSEPNADGDRAAALEPIFDWEKPLPEWDFGFEAFRLSNAGIDEITHSWDSARMAALDAISLLDDAAATALCSVCDGIDRERNRLSAELAAIADSRSVLSAQGFGMARRHCLLHAASACLHTWLTNRDREGFIARPQWLVLALRRIYARLLPDQYLDTACIEVVENQMMHAFDEGQLFSLDPIVLGVNGERNPVVSHLATSVSDRRVPSEGK